MSDDKTEEPSQKKLDDARKDGNVWKSKDLSGVVGFAIAMGVVKSSWTNIEAEIKALFFFSIDAIAHPVDLHKSTMALIYLALTGMLTVSLPVVFAAALGGGLMDFLQVGSLFTVKVLMPKLDKLNPISGVKNVVSKKQAVEFVKSMLKLSVTGYVVYGVVRDAMGLVVATIRGDASMTMTVMGELVFRVVVRVVMLLIGFSIVDVWWQHHSWKKDLMMSKEDVKKEYKESEGDPHHKAHRKQMHHEIMEGAQMEAVADADVIVTNPEHVAVALKYDRAKDGAPRVIAKGMELKAAKIRELAKAANIPLMRNVPLAHALLRVDVNQEVPEELYDAVAEVMNFVFQLQQERTAASKARA
jgi:flagellar biosynthesis protein FlhB